MKMKWFNVENQGTGSKLRRIKTARKRIKKKEEQQQYRKKI